MGSTFGLTLALFAFSTFAMPKEESLFPEPCERNLILQMGMQGKSLGETAFSHTFRQLIGLYPKDQRVFQPGLEIYIVSSWSNEAITRASGVLLMAHETNGKRPIIETLLKIDKEMTIMLMAFDQWIRRLKAENKLAVLLALSEHSRQPYADFDHSYHVRQVRAVLKEFGYGPKDSVLGLILGTATWLHDQFEDTETEPAMLKALLHQLALDIAEAVTKVDNLATREENKAATIVKIASVPEALPVKLADRIANLRFLLNSIPSMDQGPNLRRRLNQLGRYISEYDIYLESLPRDQFVPLWEELERLVEEAKVLLKNFEV